MQAFLLACYICLQLTNLSDLSQHSIPKRDNSCDQCLAGIFDQSELYSHVATEPKQTTGGLLASNRPLKQALEERLMLELSRNALKPQVRQKQETVQTVPQDQVNKAQMMVEDAVKAGEIAMRTIQEKVVGDIKRKAEEMRAQLQQQQGKLVRELELQGVMQREILIKEMEAMKKSMLSSSDWENILTEAKSLLNELNSQKIIKEPQPTLKEIPSEEIEKIMKEVQSLSEGPSSQAQENVVKEKSNKEQLKIENHCILQNNAKLKIGQLMKSENGEYLMEMQHNSQLMILDRHNRVVRTIGSIRHFGDDYHLVMQDDGNLVIYAEIREGKSVNPIWHSGTKSPEGHNFYLKLENHGKLGIYSSKATQIWNSANV